MSKTGRTPALGFKVARPDWRPYEHETAAAMYF